MTLFILLIISIISRLLVSKYWIDSYRPIDWFFLCRIFEFGFGVWLARSKKILIFLNKQNFGVFNKPVCFFAIISFPVFLVHQPLLFIIEKDNWISIVVFLLITIALSYLILVLERTIKMFSYKLKA